MAKASKTARDIISELFSELDERQEHVLTKRYGLEDGEELTLAQLGRIFGVTRERIRQIEAMALAHVNERVKEGHLEELVDNAVKNLEKTGGVKHEKNLLEDLEHFAHQADLLANFANQIRFLLEVSKELVYHREDDRLHSHWHLSQKHQKQALAFLDDLIKELKKRKKDTLDKQKFNEFFEEVRKLHHLEKEVAEHYLKISKKFGENIYGDFGLTEWQEVKPKVARDWIYLVLKKAKRPLHFSEIAGEIRKLRKSKRTNTQTIHNELIKDKRFILVGRGIYTLSELDSMPSGTIRDILVHILKKDGPLTGKQLVDKVLKNRIFKENTILFNLQNKNYFKRLKSGKYTIA
ncbi:MAG: sigma factor-like helix-turn-helix DNA-binding protein [bacterium]|nr:sigma factor-like helix-turn-helix DNA-binding protein [bacterium]